MIIKWKIISIQNFRITMNQTEEDYLIYDADDKLIVEWLDNNKTRAQLLPFSIEKIIDKGAYLKDNNIVTTINTNQFTMGITALALQGRHNVKNAMAASMAAQLLQVRNETIRESLEDFERG